MAKTVSAHRQSNLNEAYVLPVSPTECIGNFQRTQNEEKTEVNTKNMKMSIMKKKTETKLNVGIKRIKGTILPWCVAVALV